MSAPAPADRRRLAGIALMCAAPVFFASLDAAGKTLAASITLESAEALELSPGDAVTALIKAPHVILAVE